MKELVKKEIAEIEADVIKKSGTTVKANEEYTRGYLAAIKRVLAKIAKMEGRYSCTDIPDCIHFDGGSAFIDAAGEKVNARHVGCKLRNDGAKATKELYPNVTESQMFACAYYVAEHSERMLRNMVKH